MESSSRSMPLSPPRLTERRGKPELQPLEPLPSLRSSNSSHRRVHPQSSISSLGSSRSYPTTTNTSDAMSTPATPTEPHWYPSRIEEDCDCYGPDYMEPEDAYGLHLNMKDITRQAAAIKLSEKLHAASKLENSSTTQFGGQLDRQYSDYSHSYRMPPTPPSHVCEDLYEDAVSQSFFSHHDLETYQLSPDAFTTECSAPASPLTQHSSRSRRTTLLSKVLPQRFRDNIKRRMSGPNNNNNNNNNPISSQIQTPSLPSTIPLPPSRPRTPQGDALDYFGPILASRETTPPRPPSDPQFVMPIPPTTPPRPRVGTHASLHSSRAQPLFVQTDVFPDLLEQALPNEVVRSPLHAPTISPLMSPSASTPNTTLLNLQPPIRPEDQSVPSIDPTSPMPTRKLSGPIDVMDSNTVSEMLTGMQKDDEAYTFLIERMTNHGWSSAAEIRNLELQREESKQKWQRKIAGAKRVLAGLNKCGYSAPFQFPERTVGSMDTVRSDTSIYGPLNSYVPAGPGATITRTYSR